MKTLVSSGPKIVVDKNGGRGVYRWRDFNVGRREISGLVLPSPSKNVFNVGLLHLICIKNKPIHPISASSSSSSSLSQVSQACNLF